MEVRRNPVGSSNAKQSNELTNLSHKKKQITVEIQKYRRLVFVVVGRQCPRLYARTHCDLITAIIFNKTKQ